MESRPITGLGLDQQRILKQIIIVTDGHYNEIVLGSIFYKRRASPDYNLMKQAEADKIETDRFAKYFGDYPRQENYPADEIDTMILAAVKRQYPKSILRSDLILFNVDLEKLALLKNKRIVGSQMYFAPEFSLGSDLLKYVNKSFSAPTINFNIFTDQNLTLVEGLVFFGNYPVDNEPLIEMLSSVEFE
jgi:hypothetical protein